MSDQLEFDRRFVEHLEDLVKTEDRGALAALRRGVGKPPGAAAEMHPIVVPWLPKSVTLRDIEPYYLTAALFAIHQETWHPGKGTRTPTNLGASFAILRDLREGESLEKRFAALLNSHREDLPEHLRHAITLLKSRDVPVDWATLIRDIRGWDCEDRRVQLAWSRAFWGQQPEKERTQSAEGATADSQAESSALSSSLNEDE